MNEEQLITLARRARTQFALCLLLAGVCLGLCLLDSAIKRELIGAAADLGAMIARAPGGPDEPPPADPGGAAARLDAARQAARETPAEPPRRTRRPPAAKPAP
jgi:hypothetical protein